MIAARFAEWTNHPSIEFQWLGTRLISPIVRALWIGAIGSP